MSVVEKRRFFAWYVLSNGKTVEYWKQRWMDMLMKKGRKTMYGFYDQEKGMKDMKKQIFDSDFIAQRMNGVMSVMRVEI
jgi:hypothetical protein